MRSVFHYGPSHVVTKLPSLGFDCAGHREGRTVDNVNGAIGSRPGSLPVSVHPSPSLPLCDEGEDVDSLSLVACYEYSSTLQ